MRPALAALPLLAAGALATAPARERQPGLDVRIVPDQANAALAVVERARTGADVPDSLWARLRSSEGYRRLRRRETSLGRPFSDSAFRAFLLSDTLARRAPELARTLEEWSAADLTSAARRAAAYLPAGTPLRATLYPVIKPRTNSFVFQPGTDSAAIFLYVDPAVSRAKLENTLAHELHHVGLARACHERTPAGAPDARRTVEHWMGAFGEGVAMLAAAGSPGVHPHAASDAAERARWDRDVAEVPAQMRTLEAFFLDVLDGRLADPDSVTRRAMSFFGDAQGAWYTVGYTMAAAVERERGRAHLVSLVCDPVRLVMEYDAVAARSDGRLPRWSAEFLGRLR